jgi:adenine-specific DNA-methyltransferase
MATAREKFQSLLRELFQFDSADLDFGIYRIMNHKRGMIEEFIEKDLLDAVSAELSAGAVREEGDLARQLEEKRAAIRENLGADHLDGDGNLLKGDETKLGREYIELQERASGARSRAASEALVFNHLYQFLSRYYDRGDFLSLRHYSRQQKYAVPYNGEEVYLHWSNKDQYYVKTGEYFTNYRWQVGSGAQRVTILFRLTEAVVEKDNIKAPETRYFLPQMGALAWDADSRTLTLPMHWRGLLAGEEARFGTKNVQDSIVEAALGDIEKDSLLKNNAELKAALLAPQTGADRKPRVNEKGEPISRLRHHLRRYTRRNTSDFFIHKDLGRFLSRELDFYVENEVLHLDDLEKGGAARADSWLQLMRAIRAIGAKIIAFLAQIEDFQKCLFEKKKFVTECHYAITLDRVPEALYAEIAKNDAQREDWVKLCAIDEIERDTTQPGYSKPLKTDFLKAHRFLMVDTRHFGPEFQDRLLAAIPNLDAQADGLVIHSENFQALNLVRERYGNEVGSSYIDPPYNLGPRDFAYKDNYQHSSWLSMISEAVANARDLLRSDAAIFLSIGDGELVTSKTVLEFTFGRENHLGTFAWKARVKPVNLGDAKFRPQREIEYVHGYEKTTGACKCVPIVSGAARTYPNEVNGRRYRLATILKSNRGANRRDTMRFEVEGYTPPEDQRWQGGKDFIRDLFDTGHIEFREGTPFRRYFKDEEEAEHDPFYCFIDPEISGTSEGGKNRLNHQVGNKHGFDTVKPIELPTLFLTASSHADALILDHFAGSGTTGDAVISTNRDHNASRKYILIEMGNHITRVLIPRLKKVVYSKDWKDGKPASRESGVSHCIKILRLESYEDALGNIGFGSEEQGQALMELEGYKLSYLLDFETRESATFLNVAQLRNPFRYTLDIRDGEETRRQAADLPETFSYLVGLIVETRTVHERKAEGRSDRYLLYRGKTREPGTPTAVLWRDIEGWKEDDFQCEKEWLTSEKLLDGADRIYVSGTSSIEGAESLDPLFKRLLFAGTTAATI